MKRICFILVFCLALVLANVARAGNWPDPRLDAAASQVAGHAVQVWCEGSPGDWIHAGDAVGVDFGTVLGFTFPTRTTTIFIAPAQCVTLHALLQVGPSVVGNFWGSLAVHTLVHESEHQAGYVDEAQTDCAALTQDAGIATAYFGWTTLENQSYITNVPHQRKIGKQTIHWTTQVTLTRAIASPQLAEFMSWDHYWHTQTPPQYQGGC